MKIWRLARLALALLHPIKHLKKKAAKAKGPISKLFAALKKEASLAPLHDESLATIRRMAAADPSLGRLLSQSYGFAVIPRVGKASVLLGGAFGLGEVFVRRHVVGYAAIVQMTLGIQLGGQTYNELVVFHQREELEKFKRSKTSFSANASAVMVRAGAAAQAGAGTKIFVQPEGGMGIEADIGAQKYVFKPAAIGRLRSWLHPAPILAAASR